MPTKKRSGNPAKQQEISTAQGWKKSSAQMILDLPSGERCRVKRPGLPQLISDNVLPDMLTPIADKAIAAGRSGKDISVQESQDMMSGLLAEKDGLETMLDSFARVTAHCVIEPRCEFHKRKVAAGQIDQIQESYVAQWETIPEEDRDPDILYTDDVDMQDQMFIFNFVVGGSKDLAEFRRGLGQSMERMADEQNPAEISG